MEEKLVHAIYKLNANEKQFEAIEEVERKLMAKNEVYRCELEDGKHKQKENMHKLEKTKQDLGIMVEQFTESILICYSLALDSSMEETKKRDHGEYYYKILNFLVTTPYSPTQGDEEVNEKGEQSEQPKNVKLCNRVKLFCFVWLDLLHLFRNFSSPSFYNRFKLL